MAKLVRDRIPEIIRESGQRARTRLLDTQEYREALDAKLHEEVAEFMADPSIEELADIVEVIHSLTEILGYSWDDLEEARLDKQEEKGAFARRVFLEEVLTDSPTLEEN